MAHGSEHKHTSVGTNWKETREIPLTKDIYGFKKTKRLLDRDFVEFLSKERSINELFDMYNALFYEIQTYGKNSHKFIVNHSSKYAGVPLDPQIEEIENLREQIQILKDDIDSIEDEHPFIPNRSIVQNRANNELNYYIQSGRKRQIFDPRAFQLIKKQSGFKGEDPDLDFVILLNSQAIGGIVSGPPINDINDIDIDILEINRYGQRILDEPIDDNTVRN